MRELGFSGGGLPAGQDEIRHAERVIGQRFPPELAEFYRTINGGSAETCYFDAGFEYVRIHEFRSLSDALTAYECGVEKGFLAEDLFPFANDEGGNYICLGRDRAIYYYVHDLWDRDRSVMENQESARSRLGDAFMTFIDGLVTEEEADPA